MSQAIDVRLCSNLLSSKARERSPSVYDYARTSRKISRFARMTKKICHLEPFGTIPTVNSVRDFFHRQSRLCLSVSRASYIHAVRSSNMSSGNPAVTLERIDHGVLPSNDLGRAFRFWSSFMGARLGLHANLNIRGLNREVPMMIFFTVANHPGFGLALQDYRLSPAPAGPMEGVVWGFEVADNDLSAAASQAEKHKVRWKRFTDYSDSSPIDESLF